MIEKYYIFGLQRSGTTFLEKFISLNSSYTVANAGGSWKHSLKVPEQLEDFPKIVIFKNPYLWLESVIFRDPADLLITSPHLLKGTTEDYIIGHDKVNLLELVKLLNEYVEEWSTKNFTVINYEKLLVTTTRKQEIEKLPFNMKSENVPEPGSLFMSEGFSYSDYDYYINGVPTRFDDVAINLINEHLNFHVFNTLGYKNIAFNTSS